MLPALVIASSADSQLLELNIDRGHLRVIALNQEQLTQTLQRAKEDHGPDDWVSGGCLMTSEDIVNKIDERERTAAAKLVERQQRKKVTDARKVVAAAKKMAAAQQKDLRLEKSRERNEIKLMTAEDKQARRGRKRKAEVVV